MILIRQSVRVGEVGVCGADGLCFFVHHLTEMLRGSAVLLRDHNRHIVRRLDQQYTKRLIQRHFIALLKSGERCT